MRPFVLIAAIRRTGSTLLAEALTELPCAVREPKLFRGRVELKPEEHALHRGAVTGLRVGRWRHEPDAALLGEAQEVSRRPTDYRRFWGYVD